MGAPSCLLLALAVTLAIAVPCGALDLSSLSSVCSMQEEISQTISTIQNSLDMLQQKMRQFKTACGAQDLETRGAAHLAATADAYDTSIHEPSVSVASCASASAEISNSDGYRTLPMSPPAEIANLQMKKAVLGPKMQHMSDFELCSNYTHLYMDITITSMGLVLRFHTKPTDLPTDFVVHSFHLFDVDIEVFHQYTPFWYGTLELSPQELAANSRTPGSALSLWGAIVGESEGELCILAQTQSASHVDASLLAQYPSSSLPLAAAAAADNEVNLAHYTSADRHQEDMAFEDQELSDHAVKMAKRLADLLFPDEKIQTAPTSKDTSILKAAWSLLHSSSSTAARCKQVETYMQHTGSSHQSRGANLILRAAVVDQTSIYGTTFQQITSILSKYADTTEMRQEYTLMAMKSRQLKLDHWRELGSSYLRFRNVSSSNPANGKTLALFAEAASRVADNSLLKISLSHDGADETVVAALEAVLDVMRGENRHAYALVSHRRMAEILEKRARLRQSEFDTALVWNVCHPHVRSAIVVAPNKNDAEYVVATKRRWLEQGENHQQYSSKLDIILVEIQDDLRYRNLFEIAARELHGQAAVIMNSDILVGSGFDGRWLDTDYIRDKAVALSRHNALHNEICPCEDGRGIDAFVFVAPLKDAQLIVHYQNEWDSDHKIVAHICTRSHLPVYNPCHELKVYHMHLSDYRANTHYPKKTKTKHQWQLMPLGCPPSPPHLEPPHPCCSIKGKVYAPMYEQIIPDTAKPEITIEDGSSKNNSVVEAICVLLHWKNLISAPERGHEAIYLKAGTQIAYVREVDAVVCLASKRLEAGPISATIYVPDKPGLTMDMDLFLLKDGNEKQACDWVREKPEERSVGKISRRLECE